MSDEKTELTTGGIVALLTAILGFQGWKFFGRAKKASETDRLDFLERQRTGDLRRSEERDRLLQTVQAKVEDMELTLHSLGSRLRSVELQTDEVERVLNRLQEALNDVRLMLRRQPPVRKDDLKSDPPLS